MWRRRPCPGWGKKRNWWRREPLLNVVPAPWPGWTPGWRVGVWPGPSGAAWCRLRGCYLSSVSAEVLSSLTSHWPVAGSAVRVTYQAPLWMYGVPPSARVWTVRV